MSKRRINQLRAYSNIRLIRMIIDLEKDNKHLKFENRELEKARTRTFKLPESYKLEDD